MNYSDEELQRHIEEGKRPHGDELDIRSYEEIFRVLKNEPAFRLSPDFTSRVMLQITEKERRYASRDFFWLGTGIFFLMIAFIVAIAMSGFKLQLGFLEQMSGYTGLLVFGAVFLVVLNRLEKRIFHKKEIM
jgi:hypothetical protein